MTSTTQPTLFDLTPGDTTPAVASPPDQAARDFAIEPSNDVVLEASAGTGKTKVLVDRYVRLIRAGVDPRNILAITFTRKAAAEMRERVLAELVRLATTGAIATAEWRALQDRMSDIQISTIDAFCFALLREFPLEAGVDPAFDVADDTEVARFANEALDLTLRAARALATTDERVRLLLARVKLPVLRDALMTLLDRRQVALPAIAAFVARGPARTSEAEVAGAFVRRVAGALATVADPGAIVQSGPVGAPEFQRLAHDLSHLDDVAVAPAARVQHFRRRLERYFLTKAGAPRQRVTKPYLPEHFPAKDAKRRHEQALGSLSPLMAAVLEQLEADVDQLLARGLLRVLTITVDRYERLLDEHALLDFAGMLERAIALVERQEEFARSRLKLQSRFHHVLVDEFQDTNRRQWRLIDLLIDAWGEGEGIADAPTSIFVVGDRKQSIYRFRHAEVTLLDEVAERIGALRSHRPVRQAISTSFRAVPELLAFVNALAAGILSGDEIPERFRYEASDQFPVTAIEPGARRDGHPVLGIVAQPDIEACAAAVGDEIARLIADGVVVRDRRGAPRAVRADDIAILFRARAGHQVFEAALESRGVRTYVYKGLGFFDAPEVQDLQALLRFLAQPDSDLRAAEVLRSRLIRISDVGLARLAPDFSAALRATESPASLDRLDDLDRRLLEIARAGVARWLALADRVPPSELVDAILRDSAYVLEMHGRRLDQARENVKKVRTLIRRVENRGYATLGRLAEYFETLRAGDESNAVIEAAGAVHLMTIHAAKGLEFPIVFVVNLHVPGRGRPAGVSVIERGPTGAPEVTFNTTEATRLEDRRESEELRRLLYVAVTRARDRLYFAVETERDRVKRGGRSLAGLLPMSLIDTWGTAASPASPVAEVEWLSGDAARFAFAVCARETIPRVLAPTATPEAPTPRPFASALTAERRRIVTATATATATATRPRRAAPRMPRHPDAAGPGHERLQGVIVHRLFQRGLDPALSAGEVAAFVPALIRHHEVVDVEDVPALSAAAAATYVALRGRADVRAALALGTCLYEVPFTFDPPDRAFDRVRGVIDCLVLHETGGATVVEFKTGPRAPEHDVQAAQYARAISSALGIPSVESRIFHA